VITMPKMALYEKWTFPKLDKYGYTDLAQPTISISVFDATPAGMEAAIAMARRPDAVLVRLGHTFIKSGLLKSYVETKVKLGQCVKIFRPTMKIPRS